MTVRIATRVTVDAAARRCELRTNRATVTGGPSASSTVEVCRRRRSARPGGTTG